MNHVVPATIFDRLNSLIKGPWTKDYPEDDTLYDAEVEFKNGIRLLIQVVGCHEETPYVQVVAINKHGEEVGSSCDTSNTGFGGRYQCTVGAREYIVDISRALPKKCKTIPFAKLQRLAFCNSTKLPKRVIHDGVVKEWVGIGWIELKDEKPKPSDVYVIGG